MKIKLLLTSILAFLLMAGSAFGMDSAELEEHMKEIHEQKIQRTTEAREAEDHEAEIEALEQQVEQLEDLIRMMMEEDTEAES